MTENAKPALVIVDMLYDFCNPGGCSYFPENLAILPRIKALLDTARQNGRLIVYLQHSYRCGKEDKSLGMLNATCMEGTGGDDIDPSIAPQDSPLEYVVKKRRYSGFYGTDLDLILREHGINTVLVVGTKTNCCIRATVTDAYNLAYNAVVVRECVATNDPAVNQVHLDDIEKYLGRVVSLAQAREMLQN